MNILLIFILFPLANTLIFFLLVAGIKIACYLTAKHYKITTEIVEDFPEKKEIKLLGYNTFWRPQLIHMDKEEYMRERSLLLLERLDEYDIVSLEEAFQFGSNIASEFVKKAQERGFKYVCTCTTPPVLNFQVMDSGCMILSKLPIIETDNIRYSRGTSWDAFCAKGAVYARVQVGQKKWVHVFSTHLQASYGGATDLDIDIRTTQARELHDFMVKKVTDEFPVFVIGDFNIDGLGCKEYDDLLKNITLDGFRLSSTVEETEGKNQITSCDLCEPENDKRKCPCLDYIFLYRNEKSPLEVKPKACVNKMKIDGKPYCWLSDHYAVECCATLEKRHDE